MRKILFVILLVLPAFVMCKGQDIYELADVFEGIVEYVCNTTKTPVRENEVFTLDYVCYNRSSKQAFYRYKLDVSLQDLSERDVDYILSEHKRAYKDNYVESMSQQGISEDLICDIMSTSGVSYKFSFFDRNYNFIGSYLIDWRDFAGRGVDSQNNYYRYDSPYQTDIWNEMDATYTNHVYNFHWRLPCQDGLIWERKTGFEKHTVFRAESLGGAIVVHVTVNEIDKSYDLWSQFDYIKKSFYRDVRSKMDRDLGGKTDVLFFEKCRFAGQNAIKWSYKREEKDDVSNLKYYALDYMFVRDGNNFVISIKYYDYLHYIMEHGGSKDILSGFGLNAKTEY